MKITVEEKNDKQELEFPCLMRADNGRILLATQKITRGSDSYYSGLQLGIAIDGNLHIETEYSDLWLTVGFKPFNGKITLENE